MKLSLLAAVTALALSACATHRPGANLDAAYSAAPVFRYAVDGPVTIGVVQAFNKGGQTYVQFLDIARANPAISGPAGEPLGFATSGQYAVLPGVLDDMNIKTPFGNVRVYARVTPPAGQAEKPRPRSVDPVQSAPVSAPVAATPAADSTAALLAQARAELAQAQALVADLRGQLRALRGGTSADRVARADLKGKIAALETAMEKTADSVVRVSFDFGSAAFEISPDLAAELIPQAKAAHKVTVRGYTDSHVADTVNRKLALARAVSARRYLVDQGVDGKKIRAYYTSAGAFLADNSTAAGRAQNRRVEIEIVPPADVRAGVGPGVI